MSYRKIARTVYSNEVCLIISEHFFSGIVHPANEVWEEFLVGRSYERTGVKNARTAKVLKTAVDRRRESPA